MDIYSALTESLQHSVAACQNSAASCLRQDNVEALTECILLNLDCADVCQMAMNLLIRNSDRTIPAIDLCKDVCAECAEECNRHNSDHTRLCAKACRRCEENCRNFLNQ